MSTITKKTVDELATLKLKVEELQTQLKEAVKIYEKALAPVVAYVDSRASPDQGMNLTGTKAIVEFGKQRAVRKLLDPVEALRRLETVQEGLGFASISIPISVLDKHLRASEEEGMFTVEYGARSVSVCRL